MQPPGPSWARRPLVACAVLLAAYLALSLLNDPRGYLGTDTGGKVATLRAMEERCALDPDIGYWAEEWDPDGRVHPLYYTAKVGDRWVNVTTLPMLYAGYPLYRLGGYRLALVLPMLGSVLAALAARALARRLSGGDGWAAFWIVGLASPLTIYALDFWEHSLGVAAMAWAVVVLVDLVEGRRPAGWALGAGGLFGAAATLRTEALAYGFVAVAVACLVLWLGRRRLAAAVATGALAAAGLAGPLAANAALESATMGSAIRGERAAGRASSAVDATGDVAGKRVEEAMLNAAALTPRHDAAVYVVGTALVALLVFVAARAGRPGDAGPAVLAAAGAGALYLLRFGAAPGFVPGLVAATPLACVGLVRGWGTAAGRYVLGVALGALPLVWATQFQGGAAPQWAGRYLLVSGLLLGVAGVAALPRLRPWAGRAFLALAAAVTAYGLVWTSIRTHDVAAAVGALSRRPEPVLVSTVGHLAREGGAFYGDRRWLTAPTEAEQAFAVEVLERAGVTRFAFVGLEGSGEREAPPGWRAAGSEVVPFIGRLDLVVTAYEAA
ncbi:MAG: hypothetical protein ACLGIO_13775 [Acidimicrobiia bacterium]